MMDLMNRLIKFKKNYIIFLLILVGINVFAQRKWEFKPVIAYNTDCTIKAKVADKYPITMYLKLNGKSCGESSENYWNSQEISGWYYYDKKKKKIPLLGSMDFNNEYMHVYVPSNLLDTIHGVSCDIKDFKEEFILKENKMTWSQKGLDTVQNVTSEEIFDPFSLHTKAMMLFLIDGIEMASFNITQLTKINVIESLDIKAVKKSSDYFYIIFEISEPTRPGSNPEGRCGACYEEYLGFIKMKSDFELVKFEYKKIQSEESVIETCYCYDEKYPEKGLLIDKERKCCED